MTTHMMRKQIYIHQQDDKELKRLAELNGLSESELIRAAIKQTIKSAPSQRFVSDQAAWQELSAYLEQRHKLPEKGKPYVWNRAEIYAERENRWLRDREEEA